MPIKVTAPGSPVCGFLRSRIATTDNPFVSISIGHNIYQMNTLLNFIVLDIDSIDLAWLSARHSSKIQ